MPAFVSVAAVRDYLVTTDTTGQWSDGLIGSNIRVASAFLQRATSRQFEAQSNTTKVFSTLGRAAITIPDLRSTTAVTLNGNTVDVDESYFLTPDRFTSSMFVGLEFPSLRNPMDYRSYPDWFDRNYDNPLTQYHLGLRNGGMPNNVRVGPADWGYLVIPDEVQHATKVLAAWYTLRPDALLSGARQTPEGNVFDLSRLPVEVTQFIQTWKLHDLAVVSG
jgi:hypothetical protein